MKSAALPRSLFISALALNLACSGSSDEQNGTAASSAGARGGSTSNGGAMTTGGLGTTGGIASTGGDGGTGGSLGAGGSSGFGATSGPGGSSGIGASSGLGGNAGAGASSSIGGGSGAGGTTGAGGSSGATGSSGVGGGGFLPTAGPIGFATLNGGTVGGEGGQVVTAEDYSSLRSYASQSEPLIILVKGTIQNGASGGVINVKSRKSILGVGSTAFLDRVVIGIKDESNIIIRNLKITLVGLSNPTSLNDGDNISISGSSRNIWIDHCELYSEDPAKQTNIDRYDGLIDIKNSSGYITVSWNYAHDHHKGFLVGSSASDLYAERKITYHHNHFARVRKRTPTYRGAVGHVFNNYVTEADQATFAMTGTCLRVEKNFYENQVVEKFSIFTNSVEPGKAERIDNFIDGGNRRAFPPDCTADIPYSYDDVLIKNVQDVKASVIQGAGVGKI